MDYRVILVLYGFLAGCSTLPGEGAGALQDTDHAAARPLPRPQSIAPPATARSIDEFDTSTRAERDAALVSSDVARSGQLLGRSIASLGDPQRPGIWLLTALVQSETEGRVVVRETGQSADVVLLPLADGQAVSSRLSLAAMRLLGVGLAELPEVEIYLR